MSTPPAILPKDAAAAEGKVNVQINGKWYIQTSAIDIFEDELQEE
mgnify:CR=1 FL=1